MRSDPTIVAFDTSAAHCAAALIRTGAAPSARTVAMARGQAEALMPLLEEILAARGVGLSDVDALAVGVGPGNFTGIRISVSAARGLALALRIPAVGVSMFEVMAYGHAPDALLVSLPAPREMAYVQPFGGGRPSGPAQAIDPDAPPRELAGPSMSVIGHAARRIGRQLGCDGAPAELEDVPLKIARVAERRLVVERERPERPAPLYIRPADAAPPADPPPAILP